MGKRKKEKMKMIAASLLLIISMTCGLLFPAVNVYAANNDSAADDSSAAGNDDSKMKMVYGGLYDMGYEFDIKPELMKGTVLKVRAVCEEDKTIVETQTDTGYYELKLTEGRKYHVIFFAYIGGRLKNLNADIDNVVGGREINFAVRTKTVAGFIKVDKYLDQKPNNCYTVRGDDKDDPKITLSYDKWQEAELCLPDTLELSVGRKSESSSQSIEPEAKIKGITYKYEAGYTFSSSNSAIAKVDENGCVVATAKGKADITCTIEAAQKKAVCKVDVKGGFDYSRDGYCFENAIHGFYHGLSGDKIYYPYSRFKEVYGNTYTGNNYNLLQMSILIFVSNINPDAVEWEEERKIGGNCFGMSLSSVLFYRGLLDAEDYKTEKYKDGDTVNEGLYDKLAEVSSDGNYHAVLNYNEEEDKYYDGDEVCELTKMIERYQIWQNDGWSKDNEITFEEILEKWDSGKTYLVKLYHDPSKCSVEGCEEGNFGHGVVVDTHGKKPEPNKEGNYELPIYDPNYPIFTDDITDDRPIYGRNAKQRYITITVSESGDVQDSGLYESVSAMTDDSGEGGEENHAIKGIRYINVKNVPISFYGQFDYTELQKDTCSFSVPKTADAIIKGTETGTVYLTVEDGKPVPNNDSIICDIESGDNCNTYKIYGVKEALEIEIKDKGSNKRSSESTDNTAVSWVSDGAVQAAVFDGSGTVSMNKSNEMKIHTEDNSYVKLLTEKHSSDGKIVSVAGELHSGAGNDINCILDEGNQFQLQSLKNTEAILTLNTEETGFEQKAVIKAEGNSEKVDILDYMEKNKTDNPTISGPDSSESGKGDDKTDSPETNTSGTNTSGVNTSGPNTSGVNPIEKGMLITDKATKVVYKVTGIDSKKRTVEYIKPISSQTKSAKIPDVIMYNGMKYKVTSIAANAFKGNKKLTKVTIGNNVLTIGNRAFYKCTALSKITIPGKVRKIGKQAFYGDKGLKTITIKTKKLTKKEVGSQAFKGISNTAVIRIPKSKLKSYPKLLKTKGVGRNVTFKK